MVTLRYLAAAPILVRGALTGRHYRFSPANAIQEVDTRDAGILLRTMLFRREW